MAIDENLFKGALRRYASGVTVVTVGSQGTDLGMTVSSFCSVSLRPPLVLVCVQRDKAFHEAIDKAPGFAVSFLREDQQELSDRFAGRLGDGDRFAGLEVARAAVSGAPLLPGCLAWLDCKTWARHDGGDHTIFVGEVEGCELPDGPERPLLYGFGRYHGLP